MDNLDCSGPIVDQTLVELDYINYWLGGDWISLEGLKKFINRSKKPFSIIDLGCGSSTLLSKMVKKYQNQLKSGVGIDANGYILKNARNYQKIFKQLSFMQLNVLDTADKNFNCDILHASLFLHHFSHDELVVLFKIFRHQVRQGMIISDLHRHWLAYYSIKFLTRWFSKSTMYKMMVHCQ